MVALSKRKSLQLFLEALLELDGQSGAHALVCRKADAQRLDRIGHVAGEVDVLNDGAIDESLLALAKLLMARLAVLPLVLEARGLDVTPPLVEKLAEQGDEAGSSILAIIYRDERRHVAFGCKWFRFLCDRHGLAPEPTFRKLVIKHFRGPLKPPFNDAARAEAGMTPGFYRPLIRPLEASISTKA